MARDKFAANLAKGTHRGHRAIHPDAVDLVERKFWELRPFINRFDDVRIYATSAVRFVRRSAAGKKMLERWEQATGHKIRILTGKQEARYIGQAVMDEFPDKLKLSNHSVSVGDKLGSNIFAAIGGGSLQTGRFENGVVKEPISIPYGIHILLEDGHHNFDAAAKLLHDKIKPIDYGRVDTLYADCGNWRDIGHIVRVQGKRKTDPTKAREAITLSYKDAKKELRRIIEMKHRAFERLTIKLPADVREYEEIVCGARSLLVFMEHFKPQQVVLCNAVMRQAVARDSNYHRVSSSRRPATPPPVRLVRPASPRHASA